MLNGHFAKGMLVAATLILATSSHAIGPGIVQIRTGALLGSVSGGEGLGGSVTTFPYIDGEYDLLLNGKSALVFRGVLAIDLSQSNVNYAYFGTGQRFFLGASPMNFTRSEGGMSVTSNPKLNYFIGWDSGLGHVVIPKVGQIVLTTTAFDFGATAGVNWFMIDGVALTAGGTVSYLLGFSSIAMSGLVIKAFIGSSF